MKLIRAENGQFEFQLGRREKDLLLAVLRLFPRLPTAHQRLSKSSAPEAANQALLEESLAEQRAENRRQMEALLADPRRLRPQGSGWRLSLTTADFEWLLQILNDIRVGSWVILGSPEGPIEVLDEATAPHLWAMEMAGSFQMYLLNVLRNP